MPLPLPLPFLRLRDWLRRLYTTLHGNGPGLLFFEGAAQGMTPGEEETFQQKLAAVAAETQTHMARAKIARALLPPAAVLLRRYKSAGPSLRRSTGWASNPTGAPLCTAKL